MLPILLYRSVNSLLYQLKAIKPLIQAIENAIQSNSPIEASDDIDVAFFKAYNLFVSEKKGATFLGELVKKEKEVAAN